jgi:hypothetical protein
MKCAGVLIAGCHDPRGNWQRVPITRMLNIRGVDRLYFEKVLIVVPRCLFDCAASLPWLVKPCTVAHGRGK